MLCYILWTVALTSSLFAEAWEQPTQEELAIREKVIKDMAAEYARSLYPRRFLPDTKIVLRGRMDQGELLLEPSSSNQLEESLALKNTKSSEAHQLINTRNIALAGLSAGGILYFFPGQKIFFWETSSKTVPENSFREGVLMNPMIGGLLRGVLASMQRDLRNNNGRFMGSRRAGSVMMVILNPAQVLVQTANSMTGRRLLVSGTTEIRTTDHSRSHHFPTMDQPTNYLGLQFQIRF